MEDIRFIKEITKYVDGKRIVIGDCIYMSLGEHNRLKAFCESTAVQLEIINTTSGKVDGVRLPFVNYFNTVRCSPSAPEWTQHISNGKWNFEGTHPHTLPQESDYIRIGKAISDYMDLFRDVDRVCRPNDQVI